MNWFYILGDSVCFYLEYLYWLFAFVKRPQVVGHTNLRISLKKGLALLLTKKMKWIVLWQEQTFCLRWSLNTIHCFFLTLKLFAWKPVYFRSSSPFFSIVNVKINIFQEVVIVWIWDGENVSLMLWVWLMVDSWEVGVIVCYLQMTNTTSFLICSYSVFCLLVCKVPMGLLIACY